MLFFLLQCIIDYCGQAFKCQGTNANNERTQCFKNDKPTVETNSEIAICLTVLVILLGIPMLKLLLNGLRKLVLKFSNNFQEDEQQQYELSLRLNNRPMQGILKKRVMNNKEIKC